jgi:hypothetical protein
MNGADWPPRGVRMSASCGPICGRRGANKKNPKRKSCQPSRQRTYHVLPPPPSKKHRTSLCPECTRTHIPIHAHRSLAFLCPTLWPVVSTNECPPVIQRTRAHVNPTHSCAFLTHTDTNARTHPHSQIDAEHMRARAPILYIPIPATPCAIWEHVGEEMCQGVCAGCWKFPPECPTDHIAPHIHAPNFGPSPSRMGNGHIYSRMDVCDISLWVYETCISCVSESPLSVSVDSV